MAMKNGILTRLISAKILKKLKKSHITLDECLDKYMLQYTISENEKNFIYNVMINTIRNINTIDQVIESFTYKINKKDLSYFLIISAVAQIYFLNLKSYGVIDSTCEAYKVCGGRKPVNFLNGLLRNMVRKVKNINTSKWNESRHPSWFKKKINTLNSKQRKALYKIIQEKPTNHLIFKKKEDVDLIKCKFIKTSRASVALTGHTKIKDLPGYINGKWWVQDYAATIPVKIMGEVKNKHVLDMCASPGGKTFQLINLGAHVTSYDYSLKRANIMKTNARRLKYKLKLVNENVLKINENNKYDIVLLDAPCSSTGTIRRNPEILYRNNGPDMASLIKNQFTMMLKASNLLNIDGILIYSVCSIFKEEGYDQVNNFLESKNNFSIIEIEKKEVGNLGKLITKEGFFQSYPFDLKNLGGIDGFFIARLKRIK